MRRLINVIPTDAGWSVRGDTFETLLFRSGARAEAAARRLATGFSQVGQEVQVRVFLADGSLAGVADYPVIARCVFAE